MFFRSRTLLTTSLLVFAEAAISGGGFYTGLHTTDYRLDSKTRTEVAFTPPSSPTQISEESVSKDDYQYTLTFGYKHKRHRNRNFFLRPEFSLSEFGKESLYSTTLDLGYEISRLLLYVRAGASHINSLDTNEVATGAGMELALTQRLSLTLSYVQLGEIEEDSTAFESLGPQTIATETQTRHQLEMTQLGLTYYFHE